MLPTPKQVQQMNKDQKVAAMHAFMNAGYPAKAALKMAGL